MIKKRVWIIEDDPIMASCLARSVKTVQNVVTQQFGDIISATASLSDELPDLIVLDILLNGPDGFTLLNELSSYSDTMRIPIVIVSSLQIATQNLRHYGVVKILNKETMLPRDLAGMVEKTLYASQTETVAIAQDAFRELSDAA